MLVCGNLFLRQRRDINLEMVMLKLWQGVPNCGRKLLSSVFQV